MSADDSASNYAPKSPDLSSFYSAGPTQHEPAPQPPSHNNTHHYHHSAQSEYKLHSPVSGYGQIPAPAPAPASYYAPLPTADLGQPIKHEYEYPGHAPSAHDPYLAVPADPIHHHYQHHDSSSKPYYGLQSSPFQPPPYGVPYPNQHQYVAGTGHYPPSYRPSSPPTPPNPSASGTSSEMPPRKSAAAAPPTPFIEPSPVRTKFPTARIKRIMQADEEVGKVAQQTPIAVGKALELFMIQLVSKSADVAKDKGSKRVTAQMLKQVVETDDQWDFLRDIVSRVDNEKEGGKAKTKAESESEEEEVEPKKKGRGGRKKKL